MNASSPDQAQAGAQPILVEERAGRVLTLRLNRPERLNALNWDLFQMLREAIERCDEDRSIGVIVIAAAGRGFCAGGDVKDMVVSTQTPSRQASVDYLSSVHRLPLAIRTSSKVVIAKVNGPAFGAGLAIALACDIRIGGRSARFGTAFAPIGLSGDVGISHALIQAVGPSHARRMLLSGEAVDAERGLELGLIHYLVEDEALDDATDSLARHYAAGPPLAYEMIKRNLLHAETASFEASLAFEVETQATTLTSADHREAVLAFTEKRKAGFKGE